MLSAACAGGPGPDTIITNAKVFTADPAAPWAQALAIAGERIVAVGETGVVEALAGPSTRRIDAGGRTIVPGQIEPSIRMSEATPDKARALAADAYALGVTSINLHAVGAVRPVVDAFVTVDPALRVTIFRRPAPVSADEHADSRPFFPPQPTPRINARGMSFDFSSADLDRLDLVVGWAYGSEDPLSVHPRSPDVLEAYLDAIVRRGAAPVWRAKRPRVEGPVAVPARLHARLKDYGVVVVQKPGVETSLQSLVDAGVAVALAPGIESRFASIRQAMYDAPEPERVTMAEAMRLMTAAAALAEFSEDEKGRIAPGLLADLAILSADIFSAASGDVDGIRSVMTIVGGRVVRDTGAVR